MKICFSIAFSVFLSLSLFAQSEGDKFYVWNPDGVSFYSERDYESDVISILQYGDIIYIQEAYETEEVISNISTEEGIELIKKTYWLKVKSNEKFGYILRDFISPYAPMKKSNSGFEYPEKYFKREFGLKDSLRTLIPVEIKGVEYFQKKDSLSYGNNVSTTISVFDGCTDWKHYIEGWDFFEVYNLLYNAIYEEYDSIDGLIKIGINLEGIEGNLYSFGDGEFLQEAYIKEKGYNLFEVGYYYCD